MWGVSIFLEVLYVLENFKVMFLVKNKICFLMFQGLYFDFLYV